MTTPDELLKTAASLEALGHLRMEFSYDTCLQAASLLRRLAGEMEERDAATAELIKASMSLARHQSPLGAEFSRVWEENFEKLIES